VVNRRFLALLFLSSYSPVFLLLALRSYDRSCIVFWLAVALLVLSLAALGVFFRSARRKAAYEVTVVKVEYRTADVAAYVVTYLLPFLGVFGEGWRDVLALGLFIALIGVIYVNSGMLYVNPILALLGYHLLLVRATTLAQPRDADDLLPQYLLTKNRWLRPGQRLTVRDAMPDTLFAFPSGNRDDA
jgi:hypothetical protein